MISLECYRSDWVFEDNNQRKVPTDRQVCLRLCHQKGPKQSHSCSQGQYHVRGFLTCEIGRWLLCSQLDSWLQKLSFYRKLGDGLFLQSCAEVAELYPKIKYDNIIIDNCCMQVSTSSCSQPVLIFWLGSSPSSCFVSSFCCSWSRIHTSLMFL